MKPGDWVVLPDGHSAKVEEILDDDGGTAVKVVTYYFLENVLKVEAKL